MKLTHGALFQGIGGFSLAARNQGIPTIWECEIDDYCHKLSKKNFPEIKVRYRDIRSMLDEKEEIERVSIISGGFPCQPFSTAGKRGGKEDNRYLWPQTIEIIKKVRPDWLILENVPGIINLALDDVLDDLEAADYTYETFIIPALSVGANHRRDRVWIICHDSKQGFSNGPKRKMDEQKEKQKPKRSGCYVADSKYKRQRFGNNENEKIFMERQEEWKKRSAISEALSYTGCTNGKTRSADRMGNETGQRKITSSLPGWWTVEPNVGRVVDGIPRRVDRLKGLGNAIVPQIAEIFFMFIMEIEGINK